MFENQNLRYFGNLLWLFTCINKSLLCFIYLHLYFEKLYLSEGTGGL